MIHFTQRKMRFGIMLFYIILIAVLTAYDEKQSPDLKKILAMKQDDIFDRNNAWLYLLGMNASGNASPYDLGITELEKFQHKIQTAKTPEEYAQGKKEKVNRLLFHGEFPKSSEKKIGALESTKQNSAAISKLIESNREMLNRYSQFIKHTKYSELLDYGFYAPTPNFLLIRNLNRLRIYELTQMLPERGMHETLVDLKRDSDALRFIAGTAQTFLSKIVFMPILQRDILFAAELGSIPNLSNDDIALIREILRPYDSGEMSASKAFKGEERYGVMSVELSMIRPLQVKEWNLDRIYFKPNASGNRLILNYQQGMKLAKMTPKSFYREKLRIKKSDKDFRIGLSFLYNPTGELFDEISTSNFRMVVSYGHFYENSRRLAWLKVQAHVEKVPLTGMQTFLDRNAKEYGDIYTDRPMKWDLKVKRIYFDDPSGKMGAEIFL